MKTTPTLASRCTPRRIAAVTVTTLGLLLTSGCSLPFERDTAEAGQVVTEGAAPLDTAAASANGTTPGAPNDATPGTEPSQASTHELRYVSSDAPACNVVWSPGALLAVNYEWCRDEDGEPVAGIRIGSCEVVTHRNQMYAVPGQRIMASIGEIHLDQQFAQLLTSCKRKPYVS